MSVPVSPASKWPARAAYVAAAIFIGASGAINVAYGWSKGSDPAGSLTWAAVAGAVAVMFALSWPALIRSLDARRWGAAVIALAALALSGAYSVTAALGAASAGRTDAASTEMAATDSRKRAQAAYDSAQADLAKLASSRPLPEIQALVDAARPRCRIIVQAGNRQTVCAKPGDLLAELGRAQRRVELEAKAERAAGELTKRGPAKVANSDARTLARYLQALGVNTSAERLNDLLTLLAVLMIEAGGGLSLALGLALSAAPPTQPNAERAAGEQSRIPGVNTPAQSAAHSPEHLNTLTRTPEHPASSVVAWLMQQGGKAQTSRRRLATALGRSPSAVHGELSRLAASGAITLTSGPRGTVIALRPN